MFDSGSHIAVVSTSPEGPYRGAYEVRDTLVVLAPGPQTLFVHLYRAPLSEKTVAAQVLKNGRGGLWIDGCRVETSDQLQVTGQGFKTGKFGGVVGVGDPTLTGQAWSLDRKGRWPSNLLLVHAPGCQCVGSKRVATGMAYEPAPKQMNRSIYGATNTLGRVEGYAGADGKELVADWSCVDGCPVKLLDEQSGTTTSGAMKREVDSYGGASVTGFLRGRSGPSNQHGDSGGASRFYPQFESLEGALDWVNRLINGPSRSHLEV